MHCRTCGYALWNLSEPRCPECGTGFDLRTYRFTPGTVAFACPHCGHLHGGAGERYLPAETEQAQCLGCGQAMDVKAMRVIPMVDNAQALVADRVPWEDRRHLGIWKAYWRTLALGMFFPHRLGPMAADNDNSASAFGFALVTCLVSFTVWGVTYALFMFAILSMVGSLGGGGGPAPPPMIGGMVGGCVLGVSVIWAVLWPLLVWGVHAGSAHLALNVGARPAHGFGVTARCILFCQGGNILAAVPLCGMPYFWMLGYLWVCISTIIALVTAQRVGALRASIASLWLPVVSVIVVAGLYVGLIWWSVSVQSQMMQSPPSSPPAPVQPVTP
ncbi:MAG: hypothetical protein WD042_05600 [Phycisphaeraceae bacterium]